MAVPTQVTDWATSLVVDPTSGQDNKSAPPAGKQTDGFTFQETPPRQWVNYLFEAYHDYITWLKYEIDNPGSSGESGLGTAAGRDIGTANTDVPEFGTAKDLDVDTINSITWSSTTDTGNITNAGVMVIGSTTCRSQGTRTSIISAESSQVNPGSDNSAIIASYGGTIQGEKNLVAASTSVTTAATAINSAIIATSNTSSTDGNQTAVIASDDCDAGGNESAVIASENQCQAMGNQTAVLAGDDGSVVDVNSIRAAVIAVDNCDISTGVECLIAASTGSLMSNATDSVILGASGCSTSSTRSAIIASMNCTVSSGAHLGVMCSYYATATANRAMVIASSGLASYLITASGAEAVIIGSELTGTGSIAASGDRCSIISSASSGTGVVTTAGDETQINACLAAHTETVSINANATMAQINASGNCIINPGSAETNIQINASINSDVSGSYSQVNVCTNASITGDSSQANACEEVTISDNYSQANCSGSGSTISAASSQLNCATNCTCSAAQTQISVSAYCEAAQVRSVIIASQYVKTGITYSVCGGYAASGPAASSNRTWEMDSTNGNIYGTGTVGGSHTFSDYAEMFENLVLGEIPAGTIVSLKGRKVKPGKKGDRILGIISKDPQFLGGDSMFSWSHINELDEFGHPIYDEISDPDWLEQKKLDKKLKGKAPLIKVRRRNPDFNLLQENIPRSKRPAEWSAVALTGQLKVRLSKEVGENDYVDADGSKSSKETRIECMEITQKYDAKKGYAIGLCLVR